MHFLYLFISACDIFLFSHLALFMVAKTKLKTIMPRFFEGFAMHPGTSQGIWRFPKLMTFLPHMPFKDWERTTHRIYPQDLYYKHLIIIIYYIFLYYLFNYLMLYCDVNLLFCDRVFLLFIFNLTTMKHWFKIKEIHMQIHKLSSSLYYYFFIHFIYWHSMWWYISI